MNDDENAEIANMNQQQAKLLDAARHKRGRVRRLMDDDRLFADPDGWREDDPSAA